MCRWAWPPGVCPLGKAGQLRRPRGLAWPGRDASVVPMDLRQQVGVTGSKHSSHESVDPTEFLQPSAGKGDADPKRRKTEGRPRKPGYGHTGPAPHRSALPLPRPPRKLHLLSQGPEASFPSDLTQLLFVLRKQEGVQEVMLPA